MLVKREIPPLVMASIDSVMAEGRGSDLTREVLRTGRRRSGCWRLPIKANQQSNAHHSDEH
ncbi:MAG: hypothetical protein PVF83_13575 [Anaerolineales bacterium]